ncbi:DEAD/DEAH box helicase [Caldivirga sp. UBA161]|uniref:DEAD/DEAH box helicase n=1 Tax=Caldivirga sp. UBA161 TaxID=1915569 RepID=UPI0025C379DF|nr:DEAD/DEAH box helicase [Caldivirga sp. UBA161]
MVLNSFELLHPKVKEAVKELGYEKPTKVQELAIPVVLTGEHTLISSPTGTGKTEAALLPALSMMLNSGVREGVRVLYITPAKSLNRDLEQRIRKLSGLLGLTVAVRHGDTTSSERSRQRKNPPQILITTPETLQILLVSPVMRNWLRDVGWVIIDEVHELLGSKRGIQLAVGLERLVELAGEFQRIALSATIGDLELASSLVGGVGRSVRVINVNDVSRTMELTIHYLGLNEDVEDTARRISEIVSNHRGSVLLFTNTRDAAELLGTELKKIINGVEVYHGSLSRERRESVEEGLRSGGVKVVVSTSSLELGIDIGSIEAVIQYMSPRQSDRLIQRIGRSGHEVGGVAKGHVLTITPDDYIESLVLARRAIEGELEGDYPYHAGAMDVLLHQLAGIILDHGGSVTIEEAYRIIRRAHPYSSLQLSDLMKLIEFSSRELRLIGNYDGALRNRRGLRIYYLQNVSMIPDERRFKAVNYMDKSTIGELDEDFVLTLEQNKVIVLAGRLWRVLAIDKDEGVVTLDEVRSGEGELPEWIGDEIPVSYEVAQEVCRLRKRLLTGGSLSSFNRIKLMGTNELLEDIKELSSDLMGKYPDVNETLIEYSSNLIVIHSCLGTKGNEALGLYLTGYLTGRLALSISYVRDPYRVIVKTPRPINPEIIRRALQEDVKAVEETLRNVIKNSNLYRYRFIQVARRMGVLPKGTIDVNVDRLIKVYNGSVLDNEVINEIEVDKLDLNALRHFISGVRDEVIKLNFLARKPSKLALMIMGGLGTRSIITDEVPRNIIIDSVKKRIMNKEVTLLCLRCGWHLTGKVSNIISMELKCPKCGMKTLTMLKHRDEDIDKAIKLVARVRRGLQLTADEEKYLNELRERARIIMDHGYRGLIALSAYGVGTATVRRILSNAGNDDELFLNILEAEREYVRTKAFWAD